MMTSRATSLLAWLLLGLLLGACAEGDTPTTTPTPSREADFEGTLNASYYFLPEDTDRLPDFDALTPEGQLQNPSLNVSRRNFEQGFPGIPGRTTYFGVLYTGTFTLETEGSYTFRLLSDDGSRLYIDNQLVVDLNGSHDTLEETGTVTLDASTHSLRVEYFQGPGDELSLQLFVTPPGEEEQVFTVQ